MPANKLLVRKSVDSGVPPLTLHYCAVNDCYSKLPIAYRTATVVNSLILGRLTPREYTYPIDQSETGIKLAEWNVGEAMRNITRFNDAGRKVKWVAVRCPAIFAAQGDLYDRIKRIAEENEFENLDQLCLEFPQSLLYGESKDIRQSILDMKIIGVRTLMSGGAATDCPLSKLVEVPVDMLLLDPESTKFMNDRNKPQLVPSLVNYIKSMGTDVIADGVLDDEQIRSFNRLDIVGYVPSAELAAKANGTDGKNTLAMSLEEAILQKEEEG